MSVELNGYMSDGHKTLPCVGEFKKVSYEQFKKDMLSCMNVEEEDSSNYENGIKEVYDNIKLPKRATTGSAGYDFFAPFEMELSVGEEVKIPTGIRVTMHDGWVLKMYPRSGLGFKYRLQLDNTVGIIDSDYYFSDNEGHIFAKITNDSKKGKDLVVKADEGFLQGIFIPFGITFDDNTTESRNGGFGSTDKKSEN